MRPFLPSQFRDSVLFLGTVIFRSRSSLCCFAASRLGSAGWAFGQMMRILACVALLEVLGCAAALAAEPALPQVGFSPGGGFFTNTLALALSNATPGAEIYFARNGALPDNLTGTRYTNVIAITNSTEIRAVAYLAGWSNSTVSSESYLKVGADLASFTSPLPILVLHNGGAGAVPGVNSKGPNGDGSSVVEVASQRHALMILDRDTNGFTRFTNKISTATRAGLRLRGSSSFTNTKKSYNLETWDAVDQETEVSLLGMPAESEWALYGPSWKNPSSGSDYDAALIHNSFIYELANASGYYSPRTRFVEVFLNTNGGPITLTNYAGLFILTEKVKRDAGRVDFPPLATNGATGGWMLSVDRMDSLPPGSVAGSLTPRHFHTAGPDRILQTADDNARGFKGIRPVLGGGTTTDSNGLDPARDDMPNFYFASFNFDSPRGWDITAAQRQAITNFMQSFDTVLYSTNFTNAATGYAAFIDVENWAHHFILQNFPKNQDAEVLSAYLVRESATAKLKHGPIWDFDRAYNQNPNDTNPAHDLTWAKDRLYYFRLFSAPDFQQAYIDKWQSLRRVAFSDSNLLAIVDRQTNEITGAVPAREGMTNFAARIGAFKQWLTNRSAALAAQFQKMPLFNQDGGAISNGFVLALTNPNPGGTIFFTLNGADPRASGGSVAPTAQAWPQSIVLNATTVARARVKSGTNWSGLAETAFYTPQDFSALALTEIMYHPPAVGATNGEAFEFLELKNNGSNTLNLSGVRFTDGIAFTFTNGTLLAPGQFFVVAGNAAAFAAKYPGVAVGGVFAGGRLNNDGETLTLGTALGTPIFSVNYGDRAPWPVTPDGFGFSLVQKNPGIASSPDDGAKWRASANSGGSPGADDPAPAIPIVVVNEALTAPEALQPDTIELFNASGAAADVSGWFLTDDAASPKKFRIADGTVLASGDFALFTEMDFNPTPGTNLSFSLSASGDQLYLFSADTNGNLTGYSHGFAFAAAERGVSFGRHVNSVGDEHFPAQRSVTPFATNSGPRVGPAVFSEIMYHPATGGVEFIEIANFTAAPLDFFDAAFPTNTWRLSGASFSFPTNFTLAANGLVVIAGTNPATFRALYPVPTNVPVLGPFAGVLQNSGERLVLERPDTPATNGVVSFIVVDEVRYNDAAPWPPDADGSGPSLHRLVLAEYGNDPTNWIASAPSPGRYLDQDGDGLPDWWERANNLDPFSDDAGADPDGDGLSNLEEFFAGTDPHSTASALRLNVTRLGNDVYLAFNALAGRVYALQWCEDLNNSAWTNGIEWSVALNPRLIEWSNTVALPQRFYRVVVSFPEQPSEK
jgi:hypothetical protein